MPIGIVTNGVILRTLGRINAKIYASFGVDFGRRLYAAGGLYPESECRLSRLYPFLRFRRNGHAALPRGPAVQSARARDRRGDDAVPRQWNTWGPVSQRQYLTRGGATFKRACGCRPEPYLAWYPQSRAKQFGHRDSYALVARDL